jgi:hypothetical protein
MATTKSEDEKGKTKFRYFSPAPRCAVTRYGTEMLIGATRTPNGYVVDPEVVVAIPEAEVQRFGKEYRSHLNSQSLIERTEKDFEEFKAKRTAKRVAAKAEAKANADASNDEATEAKES